NYYEILGVERDADDATIKAAYRKLAKQYHPDLHPNDPTCTAKFKEINEANETLSDPQKRKQYDFELDHPGMSQGGAGNPFSGGFGDFEGFGGFGDIFNSFFGGGGQSGPRTHKGRDLSITIELSFLDAVKGCQKEIRYTRNAECPSCKGTGAKDGKSFEACKRCDGRGQVRYAQDTMFGRSIRVGACPDCNGTGKHIIDRCPDCKGKGYQRTETTFTVDIPAGADVNNYLTRKGYGEASPDGGEAGDLEIRFRIAPHKILKREGKNLVVEFPVPFTTACLGGKIAVPGIDDVIEIDVPKGTQDGTVITLGGKGVHPRNGTPGDLKVVIRVTVPKNLSSAQTKKLKEFADSMSVKDDDTLRRFSDTVEGLYGKKPYKK
ncbi:MAG: molecular chaperone DnaJ, partial [Christensenellaceae bacterium]